MEDFKLNFSEEAEKDYPMLPEGTYQVAFAALEDLGMHEGYYDKINGTGPQPKFAMWFYTDEEEATDGTKKRFKLRSKPLLKSPSPNSNLVKYFLKIMGGKPDTEIVPEGESIGPEALGEALVGCNVTVEVVHSEDGKWANIRDIGSVPKKLRYVVSAEGFEIPKKNEDAESAAA